MNSKDFQASGIDLIRYIASYMDTLSSRRVTPTVEPGYLRKLLPKYPPRHAESFSEILKDVEKVIMPGVSIRYEPPCGKTTNVVSEQVRHKLACTVTEKS